MKAHADTLARALEAAKEDARLQRLTALKLNERAVSLEKEVEALKSALAEKEKEIFTARVLTASGNQRDASLRERSLVLEELLQPTTHIPHTSRLGFSASRLGASTSLSESPLRSSHFGGGSGGARVGSSSSAALNASSSSPLRAEMFSSVVAGSGPSAAALGPRLEPLHLRMEDAGQRTLKELEGEIARLQSSLKDML
jgi:hypothetical protein